MSQDGPGSPLDVIHTPRSLSGSSCVAHLYGMPADACFPLLPPSGTTADLSQFTFSPDCLPKVSSTSTDSLSCRSPCSRNEVSSAYPTYESGTAPTSPTPNFPRYVSLHSGSRAHRKR
ncbi:unnamed protein product [Closterium sp. NIES-53]